jgi:hypothetical protein
MKTWRLPYAALCILILGFNLVFYVWQPGGQTVLNWVSDSLPVLCSLIAVYGLSRAVAGFKSLDRTKAAWILFLSAAILDSLAELTYGLLELVAGMDMNEVFPSPADPPWILAYLPLLAGLLLILDNYRHSGLPLGRWPRYLLAGLAVTALGVLTTVFVILPILADGETGLLAKVVYAYYPIADFILLFPAAVLIIITMQFGSGSVVAPWFLITLGIIGWCVSDSLYNIMAWQGLYGAGNFIDLGWNASYLLLGAAGLSQKSLIGSI